MTANIHRCIRDKMAESTTTKRKACVKETDNEISTKKVAKVKEKAPFNKSVTSMSPLIQVSFLNRPRPLYLFVMGIVLIDLRRRLGREIVRIQVGKDLEKFVVHKILICDTSPFFRAAFNSGLEEAKTGLMRLEKLYTGDPLDTRVSETGDSPPTLFLR